MRTTSIMVQNLCVPCSCRCRYCLLSWDGRPVGISWDKGASFAQRFINEVRHSHPEINISFTFGYSMDHPRLRETITFLKEIGSPQAQFLQCDGMRMRNEAECDDLMRVLKEEGVQDLNFTFYGQKEYHDRFASRKGDYDLLMRMIRAALSHGLQVSAGIPLTAENISQADVLTEDLKKHGVEKITMFVPHEEGRGITLSDIRLDETDLAGLSEESLKLLNRSVYRSERDWITGMDIPEEKGRMLLISLRPDNIERYERMHAEEIIQEIEELDDWYYDSFPDFLDLARMYGDPQSGRMYRFRDLFYHYRKLYEKDHGIQVYDVTDERQSGSRRY